MERALEVWGCHEEEESMKLMRWAMCVATFALAGGAAVSEDYVDIQAMQAKLAAQEARLNDLQAKMYGSACEEGSGVVADGLTSLRKNATVTIGGTINTRYDYISSKIERKDLNRGDVDDNGVFVPNRNYGRMDKVYDYKGGVTDIADSKLEVKIDVNDHFDAYFKFDMQNGDRPHGANITQNAWVRWKNICNSGFGLLVGRDSVKFGGIDPYGRWDSWTADSGDMAGAAWGNGRRYAGEFDEHLTGGMALSGGLMPLRPAMGANSRTVQINPYWENQDGSFKFEVSLFQNPEYLTDPRSYYRNDRNGTGTVHSRRMNDGWGSVSARATWKPIEGLKLTGSIINLYAEHKDGLWSYPSGGTWLPGTNGLGGDVAAFEYESSRSNFGTYLGFEYRPCFLNRLNVWGTWLHGWNDGWMKDQDSDSITFGAAFDILDNLTIYGLGEHVVSKSKQGERFGGRDDYGFAKGKGWAYEAGLKYTTSFGVWMDAGWRHERMTYQNKAGVKHTKLNADSFYTTLGFDF